MNCLSCASKTEKIFSLGNMPLANNLLFSPDDTVELYPLELAFCPGCTLVQLIETVPPEKMFTNYAYLTSYSPPMVKQAEELVARMMNERGTHGLNNHSLVVEIGSNDGYLLQHYKRYGIPVMGIDPSEQAAQAAFAKGIPTYRGFFGSWFAKVPNRKADIIHANNVLAHVPDPNDFVEGISLLLKEDGVAVIEVHYVRSLIEKLEFDTIYHEHVCYFSLTALDKLFRRHELTIQKVELLASHGGSVRLFVSHSKDEPPEVEVALLEESFIIGERHYYLDFAGRVKTLIGSIRSLVVSANEDGKSVAGFGAAAKATILLNACRLTKEDVRYVVDDTPTKQGRFIPGVGIPIVSEEKLATDPPDYLLILCWNFAEQVMKRFPQFKGRFILPLPNPEVR